MRLRLLGGLADLRKKTPLSILKRRNISQSSIHAGFKRFLPFKNVTRSFTRPPKNVTRTATAAQRTVIRCRSLVLCYVVWLVQNSQAQGSKTDTEVNTIAPPTSLLPTRERSSEKNLTRAEKSDMLRAAYQSDPDAKKPRLTMLEQGQT